MKSTENGHVNRLTERLMYGKKDNKRNLTGLPIYFAKSKKSDEFNAKFKL